MPLYVLEHEVDMPRREWEFATGLPADASVDSLLEAYKKVVRKKLQRGVFEGDVWREEGKEDGFPSKELATDLDAFAKANAGRVPVEINSAVEADVGLRLFAIYQIGVSSESLVEGADNTPTPVAPDKVAGSGASFLVLAGVGLAGVGLIGWGLYSASRAKNQEGVLIAGTTAGAGGVLLLLALKKKETI